MVYYGELNMSTKNTNYNNMNDPPRMAFQQSEANYNMASRYTQDEINAITEKFESPRKNVVCPRCGKKLRYVQKGNSCEVVCETENCLKDAIRGI